MDVTPWILVAVLLHALVFLAAFVWAPAADLSPPAVIPVAIYDGPNPFEQTEPVALPEPRAPQLPTP
ncbi:MAG: hypothetical protein ACE5GE_09365, partial [Phycisphaerae bacterium]